jgi:hypothetical protein
LHLLTGSRTFDFSPDTIKSLLLSRLGDIIRFVSAAASDTRVSRIAIAFAGPVDQKDGTILSAPNIWGGSHFGLRAALFDRLLPVLPWLERIDVISDDDAAGRRYLEQPEIIGDCEEIHYLTVGSGLSGVRLNPVSQTLNPYECGHWQVIDDPSDILWGSLTNSK